jgi:hypothetical protein
VVERVTMTLLTELPEPITVAERERRIAEQRSETVCLAEAAWLLVDHDLAEDEFNRACGEQEARIRQAADDRELVVQRGEVRVGELMDWAGRDVTVVPEWGPETEVLPEAYEDYIAKVNRFRGRVFAALARSRASSVDDAPEWEQLMTAMVGAVASGLRESWGVVLALDAALAGAAEDLDGEPVVHAETVIQLEEVRQRILRGVARLAEDGIGLVLPGEPDDGFLRGLQRRIEG